MGISLVDLGLVKLTQEDNHNTCWIVVAVKGSGLEHLEGVTPSEAQDLIDDAGNYGSWSTTASNILTGIWSAMSNDEKQALHHNCEQQQ